MLLLTSVISLALVTNAPHRQRAVGAPVISRVRDNIQMEEKPEFTATQLRDAGFPATRLRNAGFSATQLLEAGYDTAEMLVAGFSASELAAAGAAPAAPDAVNDSSEVDAVKAPQLPDDLLSESESRRLQPVKPLWRKPPAGRKISGDERGWGKREPKKPT